MAMLEISWSSLSGDLFLLGYVDPGIVSTALQAAFVFLFGAMAGYLMAPWRWLVSLIRGRVAPAADEAEEVSETPREQKRRAA